ncbi:hypothetical protein Agub_g6965, partial [Astrephomene gubernaculifera]
GGAGASAGRSGGPVRLVLGPTLQALHQAVATCLHALRAPLVELEQRVTTAAAALAAVDTTPHATTTPPPSLQPASSPSLPSLYELLVCCQPVVRRSAALVAAYTEVARPLVAQAAAASAASAATAASASAPSGAGPLSTATGVATGAWSEGPAASAAAAAAAGRVRGAGAAAQGQVQTGTAAGAGAAGGGIAAAAAAGGGGGGGRSVQLQLQAGVVLERLHAMNDRGWLAGVFRPLESHSHRCLLLYLYLAALEPLLDGLGEWLWSP